LKELLIIFHGDCLTDNGASETCTYDEHKMVIFSQQKTMSVLWYWETKSIIHVQKRYRWEHKESTWKTVHQVMVGTVSKDWQCPPLFPVAR
jgi:hypothetical protein